MRAVLELYASRFELWHLARRLRPLPGSSPRDGHSTSAERRIARRGQTMSWLSNWPKPRRLPWLLLISALVITADRLTKNWIAAHIPLGHAIPIIPRILRLTHWTNEGAAFSLFADSASPNAVRWALVAFTVAAALAIFVVLLRLGSQFTLSTVALALILGGALGNVHDRILYGSVIDFIEVHIFAYHFPDFNIADSSIVIGACLLLLDSMLPKRGMAAPVGNES